MAVRLIELGGVNGSVLGAEAPAQMPMHPAIRIQDALNRFYAFRNSLNRQDPVIQSTIRDRDAYKTLVHKLVAMKGMMRSNSFDNSFIDEQIPTVNHIMDVLEATVANLSGRGYTQDDLQRIQQAADKKAEEDRIKQEKTIEEMKKQFDAKLESDKPNLLLIGGVVAGALILGYVVFKAK